MWCSVLENSFDHLCSIAQDSVCCKLGIDVNVRRIARNYFNISQNKLGKFLSRVGVHGKCLRAAVSKLRPTSGTTRNYNQALIT